MVTRSASLGLPGLELAGQRLLLAAARLPYGAMAFLANLERWGRSAAGRAAGLFVVIAGAYVLGAELAWHHFSSGLAFGYPPSGVDVAALLLIARRRWPVVIAAIVVSEVGVDVQHHLTLAVALASALANAMEPVAGALFVLWLCAGRRPDLATRVGLGWFVLGAAVLGPLVGGLVGATVSWATKGGWWPGLVLQWWAGDGIAVLVIGGTLLLWAQRQALVSSRWLELVLVVLLAAGFSVVAFRFNEPSSLLFLPILAWAALRLRDLGVVLTGAAFAAVANYMTAAGYGEFGELRLSPAASVAVTQAYIALVVLVGWVLAQEVAGRMSAVQDRDSARLERAMAEARREAAELGAVLADAATVNSVGDQVSAAVRARLDAAHVVISVLVSDGRRFEPLAGGDFEPLAGGDAAARVAIMSAEWTVDSDAQGPRSGPGSRCCVCGRPEGTRRGDRVRGRASVAYRGRRPWLQYSPYGGPGRVRRPPWNASICGAWPRRRAGGRWRRRAPAPGGRAGKASTRGSRALAELTRLLLPGGPLCWPPRRLARWWPIASGAAVGGADALCLGVVSQDGRTWLKWITTRSADGGGALREQFSDLPMDVPAAATDAARTGRPVIIRTAVGRV